MTTTISVSKFEDDTVIGCTTFTVADVRMFLKNQLQHEPTDEELAKGLDAVIEKHLESAMCVAGWEYIESVL